MTASLSTMFSRRPKDHSNSKSRVIGNPVLTETTANLAKMGTQHKFIETERPPALPPKDSYKKIAAPATYSAGSSRKPYAPLQIDFNAIKRGNKLPPANEPPSPVSPLSVISGPRKHQQVDAAQISPPASTTEAYAPGKEFIAGPSSRVMSNPIAGPSYERQTASLSSRAMKTTKEYADKAATGLDTWLRAQKERDNQLPPPPPPASTKPPSPRTAAAPPLAKLKIRQSTFQPLRNSLQDIQPHLESLPPLPIDVPTTKYQIKKKNVEKPTPLPLTAITQHAPQIPPKDDPVPEPLSAEKLYDDLFKTLGKTTTAPITKVKRRSHNGPRDHLEELEDEQEDLNEKRVALRSKIWQLEKAIPAYTTTYNAASRKLMLERLDEIKTELADVDRQLHDIGMKIHRALRRRNKKDGTEGPTHLWVSRVCE